jgi:hypothetical protein
MAVTAHEYIGAILAEQHTTMQCRTIRRFVEARDSKTVCNSHVMMLVASSACATCMDVFSRRVSDFHLAKLCAAVKSDKLALAAECFQAGVGVNDVIVINGPTRNCVTPLCFARTLDTANYLLRAGANPDVIVELAGVLMPLREANTSVPHE